MTLRACPSASLLVGLSITRPTSANARKVFRLVGTLTHLGQQAAPRSSSVTWCSNASVLRTLRVQCYSRDTSPVSATACSLETGAPAPAGPSAISAATFALAKHLHRCGSLTD